MSASLTVAQLISNRLNPRLNYLNAVEAWGHMGRNVSATQVNFPYQNWLSAPAPSYMLDSNAGVGQFVTPDATDLVSGTATINSLQAGDSVFANYSFKYFTDTQLTYFYYLAMDKLNAINPHSSFTLDDTTQGFTANYPIEFEYFLTQTAYKICLETILQDMMTWKGSLLWRDRPEMASWLQGIIASIDNETNASLKTIKGRRFLSPRSTSIGSFAVPAQVSDSNWQRYAVANTGATG